MERSRGRWLVVALAGAAGCNAMFGLDDTKLGPSEAGAAQDAAPETAGGGAGSGGTDAAAGKAGSGGDASVEADAPEDASACDGGAQPVGQLDEPCCTPAELACAGHAQKLVLICEPASLTWGVATVCSGNLLCDSTAGGKQGSCQEPVALCVGKQPGDKVCDGLKSVQCGPDLVTSTETSCAYACVGGDCAGTCAPGSKQCKGQAPQSCDAAGAWQDGAACAFVCSSGDCTGVCTPNAKQCIGKMPQTCSASGQWVDGVACANTCSAGVCVSACNNGDKQCSGTVPQTCTSGAWVEVPACAHVCSAGNCIGLCDPASTQCSGLVPQTCDAQGAWQSGTACQYVCSAGSCTGVCTPGSKACDGLVPKSCDASGQWQSSAACTYVCASGACSGVCTPGDKKCNVLIPQSCNSSGQWEDGPACPYVCTAGTCTGSCAEGTKQCNGLVPQTCVSGAWQDGAACQYVCSAGTCTGTCVPGSKECQGSTPRTCDANGAWQSASACQNQACVGGACQGMCAPGSKQCNGNKVQTCQSSGEWDVGTACSGGTPVCSAGQCVAASTSGPSCTGLAASCGASGADNCCASSVVSGGLFNRGNNASYPATVSDFRMDRYEITVGRFRKFVAAWVGGWRPAAGAGKHTHLNSGSGLAATGGGYEAGWDTAWSSNLAATASGWDASLMQNATYQTWTSSPDTKENRPINYETWFEAYAFCIWDGGFLPSEAEWNYAAAGGGGADGQRQYPWSDPPTSTTIDCSYANYYNGSTYCAPPPNGSTNNVGSESTKGDGKWGQSDLAGNVWEWNLDWWASAYLNPCTNCANLTAASDRVIRGGSSVNFASNLLSSYYDGSAPASRTYQYGGDGLGARCARTP
jgi:formylglycine-generating enzyme required for sulfatase activity